MKSTQSRNGISVNNTVSQLRKSFLLINGTIAFFFLLYLLQAYVLYERSSKSDLLVIHTNDVLANIKSADANIIESEAALNSYLLHKDAAHLDRLDRSVKDLSSDIANLKTLTADNMQQSTRVRELKRLSVEKIATSRNVIDAAKNGTDYSTANTRLRQLDQRIHTSLSALHTTESELLATRTEDNRYYSKSRVVFSVISYILVSIFLIITIYKINQNIRKRTLAEDRARLNEAKYKVLVED